MTTTPLAARPRAVEPVCPPWCAGHSETFQPWEEVEDGSGFSRDHESNAVEIVEGVSVTSTQCELYDDSSHLIPAQVRLRMDDAFAGVDLLSPQQALDLAGRLLEAAERVAIRNVTQRQESRS